MIILIADSNPEKLDLYKRILEEDEHEILTAKSDLEVSLAYKRNSRIDVAVFDLRVSDYVKRLVQAYGTPTIAISDSREKEAETFPNAPLEVRKFSANNLRNAVREFSSLEQAVA